MSLSLTFVGNAHTDWAQATLHAELSVSRDNPLGEAVLDGQLVSFPTRAQQRLRVLGIERKQ